VTAVPYTAPEQPRGFVLRNAAPTDQAYVGKTWTRSMLNLHIADRDPGMRTWPEMSAAIDRVMERPETRVLIACIPPDLRTILGWMCFGADQPAPVVHYLYVRETVSTINGWIHVRGKDGLRVGTALLAHLGVTPAAAVVCTSRGPSSLDMRERYPASSHLPLTEYLDPGVPR
jgi:hypothetical protein